MKTPASQPSVQSDRTTLDSLPSVHTRQSTRHPAIYLSSHPDSQRVFLAEAGWRVQTLQVQVSAEDKGRAQEPRRSADKAATGDLLSIVAEL